MTVLAESPTVAGPRRDSATTGLDDKEKWLHERIPATVKYVDHPCFYEDDVEQRLFGRYARPIHVPYWRYFQEVPEDNWRARRDRINLSPEEQTDLLLRYNYAKCRLSKLLADRQDGCGEAPAREMVRWYRRVLEGRSALVEANMALVVAMVKRTRILNVDFEDLISEGSLALLRSIETFDVTRGHRLSTYACRSILTSFNRLALQTGRYRRRFPTEFNPDLERSDYDERKHEIQQDEYIDDLRDILARNRARLTNTELAVIMERFAIGLNGKGRTLRQVGRMVGVSPQRVQQIQKIALVKLRRALPQRLSMSRA